MEKFTLKPRKYAEIFIQNNRMNKGRKLIINTEYQNNVCDVQHEKEVHSIVNSLKEKLDVSCSIDDLIKSYQEEKLDIFNDDDNDMGLLTLANLESFTDDDVIDNLVSDDLGSLTNDVAVKLTDDEIEKIREKHLRANGKYFPWNDVLVSMYTMPERVKITETICPDCGEKLVELYFSSPKWTWASMCGRAGYMTICPKCPQQVDFKRTVMN